MALQRKTPLRTHSQLKRSPMRRKAKPKRQTAAVGLMYGKAVPVRSQALRDSAEGEACTVRLPGVCNFDPATSVLAHLPFGGRGTALKASDLHSAVACSACHDVIDGRVRSELSREEIYECCLRGNAETQELWVGKGLLTIKGAG